MWSVSCLELGGLKKVESGPCGASLEECDGERVPCGQGWHGAAHLLSPMGIVHALRLWGSAEGEGAATGLAGHSVETPGSPLAHQTGFKSALPLIAFPALLLSACACSEDYSMSINTAVPYSPLTLGYYLPISLFTMPHFNVAKCK